MLFGDYHNYGGNLYLQTTKPNSAPVYTISSIVVIYIPVWPRDLQRVHGSGGFTAGPWRASGRNI